MWECFRGFVRWCPSILVPAVLITYRAELRLDSQQCGQRKWAQRYRSWVRKEEDTGLDLWLGDGTK